MEKKTYQLFEWRNRRYQPTQKLRITEREAMEALARLNAGYTGPRFKLELVS